MKSAGSLKLLRGINASLAISDRAPFLRSRSRAEELWGVCSPPPAGCLLQDAAVCSLGGMGWGERGSLAPRQGSGDVLLHQAQLNTEGLNL